MIIVLIFGAFVGVLLKQFFPSKDASSNGQVGWLLAVVLGVAGSVVGWVISGTLWGNSNLGYLFSIAGAALLVTPFRKFLGKPDESRENDGPLQTPQRTKANRLATYGAILAVVSIAVAAWGQTYTSKFSNTANAAFGNLMGQPDTTYQLAQNCIVFGGIGALVGIVLLVVGLSQR